MGYSHCPVTVVGLLRSFSENIENNTWKQEKVLKIQLLQKEWEKSPN